MEGYWGRRELHRGADLSRPDLVRDIHRGYFAAGADMVETNSFGGSPVTLGEFGICRTGRSRSTASPASSRARPPRSFADGRHRWVVGSVGPGTKLPSLGNIAYDPLEAALAEQCGGLIAGGVDAILIETCQDTLQIKAAVNGAKIARAAAGTETPIFVQVTVETTGTLLVGPDIAAAATVVHALDVPLMGLNCATGPQEMAEHVRWLAANWPGLLSGAAECRLAGAGGRAYALPARRGRDGELGGALRRRGRHEPDRRLLRHQCGAYRRAGRDAEEARRLPVRRRSRASRCGFRRSQPVPAGPSAPGKRYFSIGERCNANGSKKWRELAGEARLGRLRRHGPRADRRRLERLDICTAFVGRDEMGEMNEVIRRFTSR